MREICLSKEDFLWIMGNYDKQVKRNEEFNDALNKMCDGFPVWDSENGYLNALLFSLYRIFNIQDEGMNTIDWYLFETGACTGNPCRTTWMNGYMVNVENYSVLYDLLCAEHENKCNKNPKPLDEFYKKNGKKISYEDYCNAKGIVGIK